MTASTSPFALVVDDTALVRMEACLILQDAGFRTLEADTGDNAKAVLDQRGKDITLLFTDVQMPGQTDGFALARFASEHWPELEIVIASGDAFPKPGDLPDRATFVSKPFDEHVVRAHLQEKLPNGKKPKELLSAV